MRIICSFQDHQTLYETDKEEIIIGRSAPIDLDLSPDIAVSRPHARIWVSEGEFWIEDLGSSFGTIVGGKQIKGMGHRMLFPSDEICIGKTTLRIEAAAGESGANSVEAPPKHGTTFVVDSRITAGDVLPQSNERIATILDASQTAVVRSSLSDRAKRLLFALPLDLARESRLDVIFQAIVQRVVEVIDGAKRGALLLIENPGQKLLLKAHYPPNQPAVSVTMAQRTIDSRQAFIWQRSALPNLTNASPSPDLPVSIQEQRMEAVMSAPLMWQNEVLGLLCVDSGEARVAFQEEDLQLLLAVAQYAAMAVANHRMQDALKQESALRANLLRQFSPKVARQLLGSRGRLRLGGERSEVTVLCSDIRGFAAMARQMEPDDVVEVLNDYFSQLIPVIFANGGTVDKYLGDGILAIFGSPEPDPDQNEKAVYTALRMQDVLKELNAVRTKQGRLTCEVGIGIDAGDVVHGFIGTGDRMEFTVIGDPVNRATRYCDGAKKGEVLISPFVYERVWQYVDAQGTTITTKHEGDLAAFRVIGLKANRPRKSGS